MAQILKATENQHPSELRVRRLDVGSAPGRHAFPGQEMLINNSFLMKPSIAFCGAMLTAWALPRKRCLTQIEVEIVRLRATSITVRCLRGGALVRRHR